jgi:hypothetical protein
VAQRRGLTEPALLCRTPDRAADVGQACGRLTGGLMRERSGRHARCLARHVGPSRATCGAADSAAVRRSCGWQGEPPALDPLIRVRPSRGVDRAELDQQA